MSSRIAKSESSRHDRDAPFWAAGLLILVATGLTTIWLDFGPFWKGYVLDMTGPGWNYILFRGRFTTEADNRWSRFFTPQRTVVIFVTVCLGIEAMQYFELYDATFDLWDLVAYISILVPLFILDQMTYERGDVV